MFYCVLFLCLSLTLFITSKLKPMSAVSRHAHETNYTSILPLHLWIPHLYLHIKLNPLRVTDSCCELEEPFFKRHQAVLLKDLIMILWSSPLFSKWVIFFSPRLFLEGYFSRLADSFILTGLWWVGKLQFGISLKDTLTETNERMASNLPIW